jgi:hypothetical protein
LENKGFFAKNTFEEIGMRGITLMFVLALFSLASNAVTHPLRLFDFNARYPSGCEDLTRTCYKVEDQVKLALENGVETREQIQMLFQAQQVVKMKLGRILPELNFSSAVSAGMAGAISMDLVLPFVGFLFPNRWFDWEASRRLLDAEKESLNTLFANRANAVLNLYFNIQLQIWSIRILKFYINEIEKLIVFLKAQVVSGKPRASAEDIGILENIQGKLLYDRAFIDALSSALPYVATAINLPPEFDWGDLKLEPHDVGLLKHQPRRHYLDIWPGALIKSTEVKNLAFLIEAAESNKRSNYFDFFDPSSGNNLGYGYGPRIKIARSSIEVLKIQLKSAQFQLSNAIQDSLNNYNDSVDSFPGIEEGLNALEDIRSGVENHINDVTQPLDINRIMRHFQWAEGQALRYVSAYFTFLIAEANLNRYEWKGRYYDIVRDTIANKVPQFLENVNQAFSFWQAVKGTAKKLFGRKTEKTPEITSPRANVQLKTYKWFD